jgi:hypothetical protein
MNLNIMLDHTLVKRVFTIHHLVHCLIVDQKDIKKYKAKLVIITGD